MNDLECEVCTVSITKSDVKKGVHLCPSCRTDLQLDEPSAPVASEASTSKTIRAAQPASMSLFALEGAKTQSAVSGVVTWVAPGSVGSNNWRAGRLMAGSGEQIKFAGTCLVKAGESVRFHGEWVDDERFGRQFRVSYASAAIGRDYDSIRRLFESDPAFRQIGPKRSQYIVDFLSDRELDLEDVLESDELLSQLRVKAKLPDEAVEHLVKAWTEKREENIAKADLISLGVPTKSLETIWKSFGRFATDTIKDNPYILTETIDGFGIADADKIAKTLKLPDSDPRRITCGAISTMRREVIGNGHTWITRHKLGMEIMRTLQIGRSGDHQKTRETIDGLLAKGRLVSFEIPGMDKDLICDPEILRHEQKFAAAFGPETKNEPNLYFTDSPPPVLPPTSVAHPNRTGQWGGNFDDYFDDGLPVTLSRIDDKIARINGAAARPRGPLDDGWVERISSALGDADKKFVPSEQQIDAVRAFTTRRIIALTGAAGTGKTATVKMILKVCDERNLNVALAAPTGKAAKRLDDMIRAAKLTSNPSAVTIHKLLGYQGDKWLHNEQNKLSYDVLILDEMSMADVMLMSRLIDALRPTTAIVLVGDHNQLPPVGPGAIFRDVIESELCHVVRLGTVFRQAGALRKNATDVLKGIMTPTTKDGEVETWRVEDWHKDSKQAHDAIVEHYRARLTELGRKGLFEIQVLSPMYDYNVGINALNKSLRVVAHEILYGETIDPERSAMLVGDKVIQTKNDYQVGLMNGDQGIIVSTSGCMNQETGRTEPGWIVEVQRGDQNEEIHVPLARTSGFMHAYAISVHRFQGSEAEHVIGAVHSEHKYMLNRPLIYTTSTRASKTIILVGDREGLYDGAKKDNTAHRRTITAPQWLVNKLRQDPAA